MTIAVTRNVPDRFRGFLASCMLEIAPGVYVEPNMNAGVRDRIYQVMLEWAAFIPEDGGVMILWRDSKHPSGLGIGTVGWAKTELINHEGRWLAHRELTKINNMHELNKLLLDCNEESTPLPPPRNAGSQLPAVAYKNRFKHNI